MVSTSIKRTIHIENISFFKKPSLYWTHADSFSYTVVLSKGHNSHCTVNNLKVIFKVNKRVCIRYMRIRLYHLYNEFTYQFIALSHTLSRGSSSSNFLFTSSPASLLLSPSASLLLSSHMYSITFMFNIPILFILEMLFLTAISYL